MGHAGCPAPPSARTTDGFGSRVHRTRTNRLTRAGCPMASPSKANPPILCPKASTGILTPHTSSASLAQSCISAMPGRTRRMECPDSGGSNVIASFQGCVSIKISAWNDRCSICRRVPPGPRPVQWISAAPANALAETLTTPRVTIGGAPANVLFSGLTPRQVGLYQVNVVVPESTPKGPDVPVAISIGSVTSNAVTIAMQ
jgi:hypothetical protein